MRETSAPSSAETYVKIRSGDVCKCVKLVGWWEVVYFKYILSLQLGTLFTKYNRCESAETRDTSSPSSAETCVKIRCGDVCQCVNALGGLKVK